MTEKEFVTVEVPIELIFHENIFDMGMPNKHGRKTEEWIIQHLKYGNSSIMRLLPHVKLFRYYMGYPNESPNEYLKWYYEGNLFRKKTPKYSQTEILEKRFKHYLKMKDEFVRQSDYFYKNPPEAKYNSKGYFNLNDGHHRATFLYTHGKRKIHVRMTEEDYKNWTNYDDVVNVLKFIKDNKIRKIDTPILNPYFYDNNVIRDTTSPIRLEYILNFLDDKSMKEMNILDIGCGNGYFSRQFIREGASVTGIETNEKNNKLIEILNKLERVDFELIKDDFDGITLPVFDIGLRLNPFHIQIENEQKVNSFLRQIDKCIKQILFWESVEGIETEKKLILENTTFTEYIKLGDTFGGDKLKEIGVFHK